MNLVLSKISYCTHHSSCDDVNNKMPQVKDFYPFTYGKHSVASLRHIQISRITTLAPWGHYEVK